MLCAFGMLTSMTVPKDLMMRALRRSGGKYKKTERANVYLKTRGVKRGPPKVIQPGLKHFFKPINFH